jgi:GGDEF domain-containing protein
MFDGPRLPRPVADIPPAALADGETVAKAWLLALLADRPLADAAEVPVAEVAAHGPELCAAVLRAVGSRAGLERLAPGGEAAALAASAGAFAGARDPAGAVAAVAALRRAVWSVLMSTDGAIAGAAGPVDPGTVAALAERLACVTDVVAAAALARPLAADLVAAEEPWRAAVERRLEAHRRDGADFALLVVEAADAERLLAAGGADAEALDAVEPAVRGAARPGDAVVRERAGRVWVVAPGADGEAARALARDLAAAVAEAAAPHGRPLEVAVGVAACPADGAEASALGACADERLFAAHAAGVPVV